MTQKQFEVALKKYGISKPGYMGYCDIGGGTQVSAWNAGARRRDQLAYLIQQQKKHKAEKYPA